MFKRIKYVVFILLINLIGFMSGCNNVIDSGSDEVIDEQISIEYSEPELVSLNSAKVGLGTSTTNSTRSLGLLKDDTEDSLTFRSSNIDLWGIETIDDIDNIYAANYIAHYEEWGIEGPGTEIINESVFIELYDMNWTFSSETSNIYASTDEITSLPKNINLIRIDIGAGYFDLEDDGVKIDQLYYSDGSECFIDYEGSKSTGINCNSIILVDNSLLSDSYLIPRGTTSVDDLIIPDADKEFIGRLMNKGWQIDVDGALFIPLEPTELVNPESISQVNIDFSWEIENAITHDGEKYIMEDRTGSGLAFDFKVSLDIED